MTKEITKAYILQEIQDKFKLRDLEPAKFVFEESVIPVYNIEHHLGIWSVKNKTMSITSATDFTFFTVPSTERWVLRGYMLIYGMTGAHKGSGVYLSKRPEAGDYIYLDLKKGQDVSYVVNLPVPVVLESKTDIKYLIDDYTSDQNLIMKIDVLIEEIR